MADAANRTGPLVISTEPFSLVPTPIQGEFSHMYRTTNDVEGSYSSNLSMSAQLQHVKCRGLPDFLPFTLLGRSTRPQCKLVALGWPGSLGGSRLVRYACLLCNRLLVFMFLVTYSIMCGHFGNTSIAEAQCRSVFAVFAVTKSPLILGAQIWNFTAGMVEL